MARQIIDNGSFDNDPGAEKIRLAFGKVNDMTAELYSYLTGTGKAIERIVQHVESGESELVEVANSVNAAAPITKPRNTLLIVSFIDPYGGGTGSPNYFKKRQYILNRPEGNYGNTGTAVLPTDFIILTPNIIGINETTTFNLGNILGAEIHEYVNTTGPYLVVGTTIFETTEGSYVFSGADGLYGLGEIQTIPQNFIPFGDAPSNAPWEKIHNLSLVGIDTEGVDELTYIANAVIQYGPFTCEPDQQIILRTTTPYDEGVIDRYYAVIPRVTSIGGIFGAVVYPSYFRPDGQSIIDAIPSDIIIELGDIGTTAIEDAFNVGDGGDPWDMSVKRFIRATYDGDVTLWSWQGEDGEFGGSGTPATADDFFLITGEPSIPITSQNNVITTIPVLDTDLTTLDAAGLETYFNALDPGIMKQGYESWLIQIVDSGGGVLKTFDLVDRGKGPIGVEAIAYDPGNAVTADMFVERVGGASGVETLTGDGVDNTDPVNPVMSFPTPAEIGTYDSGEIDALIAIKQSIPSGNFTLAPAQNDHTIANAGYNCTINPNTETYADKTVVAMKNTTESTDCDIVCTAATGWTYKINDNATVASGTFSFPNGATCTIIKFEGTNKIYIDGGVE